ncbi:DUF342 domain-containing protein [Campylobacter sp. faydin G-140]|uniref:flagellar assembly protein A n=1 Tax=Campylobacter anatolicus TaxID=2829105 RepID=UPI001BA36C05|nr:flagellar assembly protein A [Campylobacter anatolicus]MBR8465856.1 DUF342 domain-containing protein [Campylobacter anatolicus]
MSDTIQIQDGYLAPIQMDTNVPYANIKELSQQYGVEREFIDFRIQNILTTYTNAKNTEPVFVRQSDLDIFYDNEFYLDPELKIEQSYHVEFYDTRLNKMPKLPKISIGINNSLTKVIATVHKSKECKYVPNYEQFMFEYIAKQLMKAQILIGIRMGDTKEELTKITTRLRLKDEIDDDYTFMIVGAVAPVKPIDAKTIYHYKSKLDGFSDSNRIDYASRGFLLGVAANEIIIEQINPKEGRNGRDVRGKFIQVNEPSQNDAPEIVISENINRIEDEYGVKFIALKAGYVVENGGVYDIAERLEVDEVNFKTTGSIQAGTDTNVTLVVKETDFIKDAVGAGVVVEADEVQVRGIIGPNAVIRANKVVIGGQTHAKAKIYAKNADIAIHIGYVEADDVTIDRLEGGSVLAKSVKIKSVVGGSITAENIHIDTLGSNCTLTAAHLIDVRMLKGTSNRFIIDASKMKDRSCDIDNQITKIDELREEIKRIPKLIESKKIIIDENKNSIYTIKEKIEELKQAKVIPPVTFLKKLKEYQELVNEYNALLNEFKDKKRRLLDLRVELGVMQNGIFSAKVVNRGAWLDLNEIKFVLVDPPQNITYLTKQNELAHVISLNKIEKRDGNFEYRVKKSNKFDDLDI